VKLIFHLQNVEEQLTVILLLVKSGSDGKAKCLEYRFGYVLLETEVFP